MLVVSTAESNVYLYMRENVFVILNECYNSCLCDCFVEKEVENVAFTAG